MITRLLIAAVLAAASTPTFATTKALQFVFFPVPPLAFKDQENKATGALIEIVEKACQLTQTNCRFEIAPYPDAIAASQSGKSQGILGLEGDTRHAAELFSGAIITSPLVYWSKNGPTAKTLNDLEDAQVAVLKNSAASRSAKLDKKKLNDRMRITEFANASDLWRFVSRTSKLNDGQRQFVLMGKASFEYGCKKLLLCDFSGVFASDPGQHGIYFSKQADKELIKKLKDQLKGLKKTEDYLAILKKYGITGA